MEKQFGASLTEVLISLFLTSLIMSTLMSFYWSSKRQYTEAQEILSQNLDLRWVGDLLSDSIRRAGFTPCLGFSQLISKDQRKNGVMLRALIIEQGHKQGIGISRMDEHFSPVLRILNAKKILLTDSIFWHEQRPIVIADCEHAEVHTLVHREAYAEHTLITLDKPLEFTYHDAIYVGEFIDEQWFINNKSLYYRRATQTEEITPLIHSLIVHEQRAQGHPFLEIGLGLAPGNEHKLRVAVRGL